MRYADSLDVHSEPTLVIDANCAAGKQLADQLNRNGFTADIAVSCSAALAALRAKYYGSMVFVGDVSNPEHLQCIADLRKRSLRTWIVIISSTDLYSPRDLLLHYGVDALLVSRLMAFSRRSRPP
jgi:DNA-binding response OmpR family regulator